MEFRRRYYNVRKGDTTTEANYDDLLVFGYPCTIFRDDDRAEWIEKGDHLIVSPNDNELTIDRYDCRLLLSGIRQYENGRSSSSLREKQTEKEIVEQQLCDEERYRDLKDKLSEAGEDVLPAETSGSAIGYDYGTETAATTSVAQDDASSDDDEPFIPPIQLKIPQDMITPSTSNQNLVIEKTATFIATQGPQMEIIINAKQKANKRFRFLDYDNSLNKYYKHVLKMIREKKYTAQLGFKSRKPKKQLSDHESDDSDDDGNYLHPSLMANATKSKSSVTSSPSAWPTEPSTYKIGEESDVYSELYNRLSVFMPKQEEAPQQVSVEHADTRVYQRNPDDEQSCFGVDNTEPGDRSDSPWQGGTVVPPPPDLQPIIDRLAEYVARNGADFETVVRARHDNRFHFLETTSVYYPYYCSKINWYQYEHYMSNFYHGGGLSDVSSARIQTQTAPETRVDVPQKSAKPLIDHPWCTAAATDSTSNLQKPAASTRPRPFNKSQGVTISFSLKPKEKQDPILAVRSKNMDDSPTDETNKETLEEVVQDNQSINIPDAEVKQPEVMEKEEEDSCLVPTDKDPVEETNEEIHVNAEFDIKPLPDPPVVNNLNKEDVLEPFDMLDVEQNEQSASTSLQSQRRLKARLFLDSLKRPKENSPKNVDEKLKRKNDEISEESDQQRRKIAKRRRRRSRTNS